MSSATTRSASLGTPSNPLHVAIVGSGPAGFYAAEALINQSICVRVDMFERLPVPYGLVRYGVAPDHPKLKQPTAVFDTIAASPKFAFFGNVTVGRDLSMEQLAQTHHAVLFACGAESERKLGLPNEDLAGCHAASEFVGWYNGHPDHAQHSFSLDSEVAVIIGQGNVALDLARLLAKPIDDLRHTDIADHALEALAASRVREIHIVGRRGPAQSNFTAKELRELGQIRGCVPELDARDLELADSCLTELTTKSNFNAASNVETLRKWTANRAQHGDKRIRFHFLRSPTALLGQNRLRMLSLQSNRLGGPAFAQVAHPTGVTADLDCGLLFRSIGYRGRPLPGVPFDDARGVFPNTDGRIGVTPGLYAAGWIKRGPSGVIGTNRGDAVATVQTLLTDLARCDGRPRSGSVGLDAELASNNVRSVSYPEWSRLDAEEQRRGALIGKPRQKITRVAEMLALLD